METLQKQFTDLQKLLEDSEKHIDSIIANFQNNPLSKNSREKVNFNIQNSQPLSIPERKELKFNNSDNLKVESSIQKLNERLIDLKKESQKLSYKKYEQQNYATSVNEYVKMFDKIYKNADEQQIQQIEEIKKTIQTIDEDQNNAIKEFEELLNQRNCTPKTDYIKSVTNVVMSMIDNLTDTIEKSYVFQAVDVDYVIDKLLSDIGGQNYANKKKK
ncbi:hypothetical protein TRFO_05035 [Tritrichomonas foetus]|uniref:Uncharacterized protein n=1 Tax=Tritrichomonas foetus TaxID=1144522 RepID=A0A1J4K8U9_9EUKA|nr:hypothetical protein TRFO_05035 [Tritrichomonas foetus]|eukprot:OHT07921.1 hypothetical protein TRFO_05035 [Tritrichomonas foetus]